MSDSRRWRCVLEVHYHGVPLVVRRYMLLDGPQRGRRRDVGRRLTATDFKLMGAPPVQLWPLGGNLEDVTS